MCKDIEDEDVQVANGSSSNKYIMFLNNTKKAAQGSLRLNKYFEKGIPIDIYSKIKSVASSYYMQKCRKLFILDNEGHLYYKDLVHEDSETYMVKSTKLTSEGERDSSHFQSTDGQLFIEIDVSKNESIIFLRTKTNIECYDINFIQTHLIPLKTQFTSFKNILYGNECFLIIQNNPNNIECYKLIVPKHETQIETTKKITKIVEGNPVFDIHHIGLIKFGPMAEDTQIIQGERSLYYYSKKGKNDKILKYMKNLKAVSNEFKIGGFLSAEALFDDSETISKERFILSLCVRLPLHVASIQNGNLIPLQNGTNNFEEFSTNVEKESFLDSLTDYIKFGNYEEILENIDGPLVMSIIGRQSSGKSYLLNRLAGTRFDVAAERCTEGIWMGIGFIKNVPVVVFDCEGLFTVERSTQEEIKLCLFLSSLSDIIILNSDLSSGKHIKSLFDEFASGVDRLKGKNLFKGHLDITYRDIPDNQGEGASYEFSRFLQSLLDTGRKETLYKLFSRDILNSLYHNFENNLFDNEVENTRESYINDLPRKWGDRQNLCLMMKMILAQIFSDDIVSVDIRLFSAQTRKLRELIDSIINNPEVSQKLLPEKEFKDLLQIESTKIEISLKIKDFYRDQKKPLKYFTEELNTKENETLKGIYHNNWFTQLDVILKAFFNARKELVVSFYREKIPKSEEFKEQIALEVLAIENKLDKVSNTFNLCLRKCNSCDFICTLFLYHEGKCDCGTSHFCVGLCEICEVPTKCNLLNGHKFKHICNKLDHKCPQNCEIPECEKPCTQIPGHEGLCKCSSSHPCGKKCKMNEKCGQLCKFDVTVEHLEHSCDGKCPFNCIFEDGNNCFSHNHFHDDELEEIEYLPSVDQANVKVHLCGTNHKCKHICEKKGICIVKTSYAPKVYKNDFNEFVYIYADLYPERQTCGSIINSNEFSHAEKDHHCTAKTHICDVRCPDCNCFCGLHYGHEGLHSSDTHRNKECSQYISTERKFESIVHVKEKKTAVTFVAGEPATPEICDQYCQTKGRGHTHPIPCKGDEFCLEKTDRGYAVHSSTKYKTSHDEICYFDFVTCDTYWKKCGWHPPNSKTPGVQEIFGKCNYQCGHPSHAEKGEKVFCEENLYHSLSHTYGDHNFRCVHEDSGNYDFVFIVDCTGSMSSSFPQVKNVINNLLKKWGNETNKFSVIGYTDHAPDNGKFPASNPVSIFPPSLKLEDGNAVQAGNFIGTMSCSGGGGKYGEALIDGLAQANRMVFRKDTSRMYILVCDDSPHGDEFLAGTTYPAGCPCGHKWRDLLAFMKTKDTSFIFVKLSDLLNKTVQLFQEYYGQKLIVMPLNNVNELEVKVTNTVIQTVDKSHAYSTKFNPMQTVDKSHAYSAKFNPK
jgi:hypothetical protein